MGYQELYLKSPVIFAAVWQFIHIDEHTQTWRKGLTHRDRPIVGAGFAAGVVAIGHQGHA